MDQLTTLGTALGLTAMAGINLYLTVFVTGVAIRLGWLELATELQSLQILSDPVVLVVAGLLLLLELVIDKCPYADNAWDSIHTVIRPIGGAFLALNALGTTDPVLQVVAALLGGSVAFSSHSAKAGSRLMVNTSPEPATTIAASVTEDTLVLGGVWLAFSHPLISLVVVTTALIVFWYFAPKFYRLFKANLVGMYHRLAQLQRGPSKATELPSKMASFARPTWSKLQHSGEEVAWVVPCFSGRMKPLGRNLRGCVLATSSSRLFFIGRKSFGVQHLEITVHGLRAIEDPGSVFHRLLLETTQDGTIHLRFTRKTSHFIPLILEWIDTNSQSSPDLQPAADQQVA